MSVYIGVLFTNLSLAFYNVNTVLPFFTVGFALGIYFICGKPYHQFDIFVISNIYPVGYQIFKFIIIRRIVKSEIQLRYYVVYAAAFAPGIYIGIMFAVIFRNGRRRTYTENYICIGEFDCGKTTAYKAFTFARRKSSSESGFSASSQ